jgi:AraC family transcriptional regulator
MPNRKMIKNAVGASLYSMQIYPPLFFTAVKLDVPFEKWAMMEVSDFDVLPMKWKPIHYLVDCTLYFFTKV